jgi:PAS domain S-box-containing protein
VSLIEEPGAARTGVAPEGELRESTELYRLLAEHSTDMISKHTPSGVYTYASPACRSLLGYDPEELVGRDAYEFFHPDDFEEIQRTHSTILEHPDTYTVAYRIRRKDGSYIWFETTSRTVRETETGEVLEIITVSRDVTERKRAEEELRESEERFRAFFETAAVGAAHADPATGRLLQVNEKLCRFLGYEQEELLSLTFADLTHPDDRAQDLEGLARLLRGEVREYAVEKRYVRKDGQTVWGQLAVSLVRDGNGRALHTVSITQDVTERRRLEEGLREIREAERRRIARELHDVVLQDLTYALQSMQVSKRMPGGSNSADDTERQIEALKRSVGGLREAIYDLRLDSVRERPLIRAVASIVELNRQIGEGCEFELIVDDGFPVEVSGSAGVEVVRVVQEALANGRRHSGAEHATVTLGATGGEVLVEVEDDGRGFGPETSYGMGLTGMSERVLALGGTLDVEGREGAGTRVLLRVGLAALTGGEAGELSNT